MSKPARRRGNGEGSIHQRADGRWEARLDLGIVNGKRKRVSVYGQTRREVQDKLRESQSEFEAHGRVLEKNVTLSKWLDHWVNNVLPLRVASGTLAQSTFANYVDCVERHLKTGLGQIRLTKLSPTDIDAFLAYKRKQHSNRGKPYSSNSLRLMRSTLRKALTDAQRAQLVVPNVAALSEPVRVEKQAQGYLTENQARALLAQVRGDRFEVLYILFLSTGMRRGEALGLSWSEVDLDKRTLLVRRAIKRVQTKSETGPRTVLELGPTKTRSSVRTVLVPKSCVDALKKHRARQAAERLASHDWHESELVFTTSNGSPIDPANFAKWLSKHCIAAGIGHRSPHKLRHSTVTLLLAQGIPIHEVSELMGHSSLSVTKDVYGHLTTERRHAAAEAMERILAGNE
jgi:integrase